MSLRPIPSATGITDPQARAVIAALTENLETLAGQRGKPAATSRAVTFDDLVSSGMATVNSKGQLVPKETETVSSSDEFQKWLESQGPYQSVLRVFNHTQDATISASDSGAIHSNEGAKTSVTLSLPAAEPGLTYLIIRSGNPRTGLYLGPATGDAIWHINPPSDLFGRDTVMKHPRRIAFAVERSLMRVTCIKKGLWAIEYKEGEFGII
jgi:hypothetical protein